MIEQRYYSIWWSVFSKQSSYDKIINFLQSFGVIDFIDKVQVMLGLEVIHHYCLLSIEDLTCNSLVRREYDQVVCG